MIIRKIKNHPERGICEQFAYLPKLAVYPNSSDINELSEIVDDGYKKKRLLMVMVLRLFSRRVVVG